MRIVFLGGSEFSVPSFERLIADGHEILAAVCQPDRPNSRGNKIEFCPLKKSAIEHGVKVLQFQKIRIEGTEEIKKLNPDLMVVVSYGQILPEELINIPKLGTINVHGSLLPKYRGASPIVSAILNGEQKTGITIMRIAKEVDAGNILFKAETDIDENETGGELSKKLSILGANLLSEAVIQLEKGNVYEEVQDSSKATFTKMIRKEDGEIDFSKSMDEIVNKIRAFNPTNVAYTTRNGEKIKIYEAKKEPDIESNLISGDVIVSSAKEGLVIKCGNGAVRILRLQAPNGKILDAKSFLNGRKF